MCNVNGVGWEVEMLGSLLLLSREGEGIKDSYTQNIRHREEQT